MKELQYKLIVSDFDGTLRRSEGGVSEETIETVRRYTDAGGTFALCTGRMPKAILPCAHQLGLSGLVGAYQGAVIEEIGSGKLVRDGRIPTDDAIKICTFMQENGWHIHVYDGDDLYINMDDDFRAWYEKTCNVRGILTQFDISATVREKNISPHKIVIMCPAEERKFALDSLESRFGEKYYVTTSSENLVEIVKKGCNKGGVITFLAQYYGIPLSQTIAIGDNLNDLPMLRAAGLGVVVENGEEELKKEADFITRSCDSDGVAYVIKKFGLGENV